MNTAETESPEQARREADQMIKAVLEEPMAALKIEAIKSDVELGRCNTLLRWIKTKYKDLDEQRKKMTRPLDESKRQVMEWFSKPLQRLEDAERTLKGRIVSYEMAVADKRAEEQRIENERAAKQAEAQKANLLDAAEAAIEQGDEALADRYLTKAENAHAAPINVAAAKRPGSSLKSKWSYKIVDESKIPDEYWVLDLKRLAHVASAMKEKLNIPGVEAVEEKVLSTRSF